MPQGFVTKEFRDNHRVNELKNFPVNIILKLVCKPRIGIRSSIGQSRIGNHALKGATMAKKIKLFGFLYNESSDPQPVTHQREKTHRRRERREREIARQREMNLQSLLSTQPSATSYLDSSSSREDVGEEMDIYIYIYRLHFVCELHLATSQHRPLLKKKKEIYSIKF